MSRLLLLLLICPSPLLVAAPSAREIVQKMDTLYRSDTSQARVAMEIVTPNWSRTLEMTMVTEGMKNTLVRILAPKKDKGIATLRKDDQMWNYFPKVNKTIKVPPSMMMGSWMGSDFTNDDLVRETSLIEDYTLTTMPETKDVYIIELRAKGETTTVWTKIELRVRKEDLIPIEQTFFDEKGKAVRKITFSDIKTLGGRKMPTSMEVIPLTKDGHKTVVRYEEAEFNVKLPEDTFSLRKLRD